MSCVTNPGPSPPPPLQKGYVICAQHQSVARVRANRRALAPLTPPEAKIFAYWMHQSLKNDLKAYEAQNLVG